jgi:hypothetical protein
MAKTINNKKDILLLLLYTPGRTNQINEPIIGKTRLVKMLFIFKKEFLKYFSKGTAITEENFYDFFPWKFGPFSSDIYDDIMFFTLRDFIEAGASTEEILPEAAAEWENWMQMSYDDPYSADDDGISEYEELSYKLSEKGLLFTQNLFNSLSQDQQTTLKTFKEKFNGIPLGALIRYVYDTYPEYIEKSLIKDKVILK